MTKLVSIIITTCNGTFKLIRAVESSLKQSYKNVEVIVVDDNGKDTPKQIETEEMLASYITAGEIKYVVHNTNKNGAAARNTGVRNAEGEYLAFLDDDDFFFPERIQELVLKADEKQVDVVYSDVLFVRGKNMVDIMSAKEKGFSCEDLLTNQGLLGTGSNIFIKRDIYDAVNGFDETFFRYQDVEFMIRALKFGKIAGVDKILVAKDITEVRFYPKYDRFTRAQEMLLEKFAGELDNLEPKKKREAMYAKRAELYYSACMSGNRTDMHDAFKLLESDISDLTNKEIFRIKLKGLYLRNIYPAIGFIRERKQKYKNKKLTMASSKSFLNDFRGLIDIER